jgi:preprotein translocase subunit SecY
VADNLKNQNGFVPGIRPGKRPRNIWNTWSTASWCSAPPTSRFVCLLPEILRTQLAIPFYFGGTSILIIVSVTMDTMQQIQSICWRTNTKA